MSSLLPRAARYLLSLSLAILCLVSACKKQTNETVVDAFAQVNPEAKYNNGVYNIQFSLQEYPYDEVTVNISESKNNFHKNTNLIQIKAYQASNGRYGVFINTLAAARTYYYQIRVKDSAAGKLVNSDIYSFTTNP